MGNVCADGERAGSRIVQCGLSWSAHDIRGCGRAPAHLVRAASTSSGRTRSACAISQGSTGTIFKGIDSLQTFTCSLFQYPMRADSRPSTPRFPFGQSTELSLIILSCFPHDAIRRSVRTHYAPPRACSRGNNGRPKTRRRTTGRTRADCRPHALLSSPVAMAKVCQGIAASKPHFRHLDQDSIWRKVLCNSADVS